MQKVGAALWVVVGGILVLLLINYVVLDIYDTKSLFGVLKLVVICLILMILFVVEGAEVAALSLLDKDPEQIGSADVRVAFQKLKADPEGFLTGRQLLVVASIVALTFLCDSFAATGKEHAYLWGLGTVINSESARGAFAFLFPTFIVLWFAQLLPKFMAQAHPLRVFSWTVTQLCVRVGIFFAKIQIGTPSQLLKDVFTGDQTGQTEETLLPSRNSHYKSSATLRGGRGMERVELDIRIGQKGEVTFVGHFCLRCYGPGFRSVTAIHEWLASIDEKTCEVTATKRPTGCGELTIEGPLFFDVDGPAVPAAQGGKTTITNGGSKWNMRFQDAVPIGEEFNYTIKYKTGMGGCEVEPGKSDDYLWVFKGPTAFLCVTITPADDVPIVLTQGVCTAVMSGELDVDSKEAARVKMEAHKRGYRFSVKDPLEGTHLTMRWIVATSRQ